MHLCVRAGAGKGEGHSVEEDFILERGTMSKTQYPESS